MNNMITDNKVVSHFRVKASPSVWTMTIPLAIGTVGPPPSRWNRLRKHPFGDWIIKLTASTLVKELVEHVLNLFLRVRTASEAHGRSHAA